MLLPCPLGALLQQGGGDLLAAVQRGLATGLPLQVAAPRGEAGGVPAHGAGAPPAWMVPRTSWPQQPPTACLRRSCTTCSLAPPAEQGTLGRLPTRGASGGGVRNAGAPRPRQRGGLPGMLTRTVVLRVKRRAGTAGVTCHGDGGTTSRRGEARGCKLGAVRASRAMGRCFAIASAYSYAESAARVSSS